MLNVYAIKHKKKIRDCELDKLLGYVSEMTRKRVSNFIRWRDAQRTLIGELLVRSIICEIFNLSNEEIVFERNCFGKPFFRNSNNFFFNLSHAGEWIVCAVNESEVGVDVEKIRPSDFRIAKRFFSEEEYEELMMKEEKERLDYFYALWTLKESYIKVVGKGLSMPLNDFTISINSKEIVFKHKTDDDQYTFKQYNIGEGYRLSVCVAGEINEEQLVIQALDEVANKLEY